MAQKTVKFNLNIGTDDQAKFVLEEAYQRDEVVTLDAAKADQMIARGWAKEYTDDVKKEEEAQAAKDREFAIKLATPRAIQRAVEKEADKVAEQTVHASPSKHAVHKEAEHHDKK